MLEALREDWARHQHQQQEAAQHEAHSRGSVSVAMSPGQPGEVQRLQAQIASLQEQLQEAGAQLVSGPATQLQQGGQKQNRNIFRQVERRQSMGHTAGSVGRQLQEAVVQVVPLQPTSTSTSNTTTTTTPRRRPNGHTAEFAGLLLTQKHGLAAADA